MFTQENGHKILKDGERHRTPLVLMDSVQRAVAAWRTMTDATAHRPHAATLTDEDKAKRIALHAAANKKLSDRWRSAPSLPLETVQLEQARTAPAPATTDLEAAYARRDRALEQRWKGAAA